MEFNGVKGIKETPQGKFEVTISHPSIPGGRSFSNHDTIEAAASYKINRLDELRRGIVLEELKKRPVSSPMLTQVLREYLNSSTSKISASGRGQVEELQAKLTGTLEAVTTTWVDSWVQSMKRVDKLAPGTIRKKVGTLARAIDWWNRKQHPDGKLPGNPLRNLGGNYSTYDAADGKPGEKIKKDVTRNRRLMPGEFERITEVMEGKKRADRERAWGMDQDRRDFVVLFHLIVFTGLRLREAYRLRWSDFRPEVRTLHVEWSKTDKGVRDIPTTRAVEAMLTEHKKTRGDAENIFPWWNGSHVEEVLETLSKRLGTRFGSAFAYAKCLDLTEHDLRHEAVCRWFEKKLPDGHWMFRAEEIKVITGHKTTKMLERYLSLQGSALAHRLD